MKTRSIIKKTTDFLFPPTCAVCGELLFLREEGACGSCRAVLSHINPPCCFRCGKEISDEEKSYCEDCGRTAMYYKRGFPVFNYDEAMQESIAKYKYHNRREFARFYVNEIISKWEKEFYLLDFDAIIPIPLSRNKMKKRGYNQAKLVADLIGEKIRVHVDDDIIIRKYDTTPQKELDYVERKNNLQSAFVLSNQKKHYRKVLLVDDIYTTGATINSCSKILCDSGIKEIYYTSICIGKGY